MYALENHIASMLHKIGVPVNSAGFRYIKEALIMVSYDVEFLNKGITKRLYPEIAYKFNTTPNRVEAAIRRAIATAWEKCGYENVYAALEYTVPEYINSEYIKKPRNSQFLAMASERLRFKYVI